MRFRYGKNIYGSSGQMFKKLHLEVTTCCNMSCKKCSRVIIEKNPEHMNFENFKTIVDKIPGLAITQITGLGETLLNPDIVKQLTYLKSKHIYTGISTNGTGLTEEMSKDLLELGLDWIDISLPSADPEIYKQLRGIDAIANGLLDKISFFQKLNRSKFNAKTETNILIVYSQENKGDLLNTLDYISSVKINKVIIKFAENWDPHNKYLQTNETTNQDITTMKNTKEVKNFLKECEKRSIKCSIKCQMNDVEFRKIFHEQEKCESPWYHFDVLCNGDTIPCLCTKELNRNYIMGNLIHQDFNTMWNGRAFINWRKKILSNDLPDPCNYCTRDITSLFK